MIGFTRFQFFSKHQDENEAYSKFITDLKKLAKPCELDNLKDGLIRDQITIGMKNKSFNL